MNNICEWRKSPIFPSHYEVSSNGDVRNNNGKVLKPTTDKDGYRYYVLCVNGTRKTVKAHRLVAMAYIENKENKPSIDHINGIKTDNRVENLRWVTNKENTNNPLTLKKVVDRCMDRIDILKQKAIENNYGRKSVLIEWNNGDCKTFSSLKEASIALGENYSKLSERANGKRPQKKTFKISWMV